MKQKKSKLDQYAAQLADMDAERKTLPEMQAWLKEEGITVASSTLSAFLSSQRQRLLQDRLLAQIATGARQCQEVEKQFGKNPAPELETLIKLHRSLIMQLATLGNADPEFLKLSDQLTNTVLSVESAKTKAAFKEREIALAEQKYLETKKDEQTKALELCLEEAKGFPDVQELFKAAFAALKKAKTK